MNVYLAGGAVRDLLLGKDIADRDYLVMDTTREAFQKKFPRAQEVGKAFPVFLLNRLEFSFPRAATIQQELRSRDLTVNAMLLDEDGNLLCHTHALEDMRNKMLRPASPTSLHQDPLRVYRAARFLARYPDFSPHPELEEAMKSVAEQRLLSTVSPDRVGVETLKALNGARPGNFLRLLARTDCLCPWFEEFSDGLFVPAGPPQYHDTDVIEHTCRMMDALAGTPMAVWMAMCHDLGKLLTDKKMLPKHHGHDKRGMPMAKTLARRLKLSNNHMTAGIMACKWHMIAGQYNKLRPGTKVDLLMNLHLSGTLDNLFALVAADQKQDFSKSAKDNLATILAVSLPLESRNLGARSGEVLRELRALALARKSG